MSDRKEMPFGFQSAQRVCNGHQPTRILPSDRPVRWRRGLPELLYNQRDWANNWVPDSNFSGGIQEKVHFSSELFFSGGEKEFLANRVRGEAGGITYGFSKRNWFQIAAGLTALYLLILISFILSFAGLQKVDPLGARRHCGRTYCCVGRAAWRSAAGHQ